VVLFESKPVGIDFDGFSVKEVLKIGKNIDDKLP